ncbi:hypothetical protein C8J57DRAFT_1672126 [Mycena rebaudengoi]|nr:hypothetical protein C8J57DRAFT_1672126 [Mycena rebaudengoi]
MAPSSKPAQSRAPKPRKASLVSPCTWANSNLHLQGDKQPPWPPYAFRCPVGDCPWSYPREIDLDRHGPQHMSVEERRKRMFACPWEGCDHRTLQKSNLLTHYLTHTGEKPLICATIKEDGQRCTYCTGDPASMSRHRSTYGHTPPLKPAAATKKPKHARGGSSSSKTHRTSRSTPYSRPHSTSTSASSSSSSPASDYSERSVDSGHSSLSSTSSFHCFRLQTSAAVSTSLNSDIGGSYGTFPAFASSSCPASDESSADNDGYDMSSNPISTAQVAEFPDPNLHATSDMDFLSLELQKILETLPPDFSLLRTPRPGPAMQYPARNFLHFAEPREPFNGAFQSSAADAVAYGCDNTPPWSTSPPMYLPAKNELQHASFSYPTRTTPIVPFNAELVNPAYFNPNYIPRFEGEWEHLSPM